MDTYGELQLLHRLGDVNVSRDQSLISRYNGCCSSVYVSSTVYRYHITLPARDAWTGIQHATSRDRHASTQPSEHAGALQGYRSKISRTVRKGLSQI